MRRSWRDRTLRGAGAALAAAMSLGATAHADTVRGTWCGDGWPLFFIDEFGVGFGDHVTCEVATMSSDKSVAYHTGLTCIRSYETGEVDADGNGVFFVEDIPDVTALVAVLLPGDRLAVHLDNEDIGVLMERCD